MDWQYDWGLLGWVIGLVAGVLYLRYGYRVWRASRRAQRKLKGLVLGFKLVLRGLVLGLLLVALWGPLYGYKEATLHLEGRDIYFCVDLSASMNAPDVSPTRIARIKRALRRQIKDLEGSRMGIIIFSSEAFIQCPLTYDVSALYVFVDALHTGLVPSSGTNLGAPLRMALSKFKADSKQTTAASKGGQANRVRAIVLYSDGEDFEGGLSSVGRAIAEANIRLYVCGVGTEEGSQIPIGNGRIKRDKTGKAVITRYESKSLRRLTATANGDYFRLSQNQNELDDMTASLRALRATRQATRSIDIAANQYMYFLVAALLLAGIDWVWRPTTLDL